MRHERIHDRAVEIARTSSAEHFLHAAVIHKGKRFLVGASNVPHKTHPQGSGPHSTAHAEIRAIIRAKRMLKSEDLSGYSIYVLRLNRCGVVKLSKPCPDCMKFIEKHGLRVDWSEENVAVA